MFQPIPPVLGNKVLRFKVAYDLLKQAMKMPSNCRLVMVTGEKYHTGCTFLVVSEDFPESEEGALIPEISPQIMSEYCEKCGHSEYHWDWRMPEKGNRRKPDVDNS